MTTPSAGILAAFSAQYRARRHGTGIACVGEDSEPFDLSGLDDVTGEQQPPGQHRPQPIKEHVEAAERRPDKACRRHADLRIPRDNGDVGHQRHLESAAEGIPGDFAHRHLRKAHEVVVKAK
jgi:hypothetical protein